MSRSELHELALALRNQIRWQGGPNSNLIRVLKASPMERSLFEATCKERTQREIARSKESFFADEDPPQKSEIKTTEKSTASALWKTKGNRPTSTFKKAKKDSKNLEEIREELGPCSRCKLSKTRTNIVFGVGSPTARLMIVGEAPGKNEDLQGEPFVGKAGALLDKMIIAMGLTREEIYISNVLKCRPPENRDPEREEVSSCSPFLKMQIESIQPEVIVAMGKFASNTLVGTQGSLSAIRGNWHEFEGIPLMATFHPAYLLRNEGGKREAWSDLKQVMKKLNL